MTSTKSSRERFQVLMEELEHLEPSNTYKPLFIRSETKKPISERFQLEPSNYKPFICSQPLDTIASVQIK
jgi:hypothetical protein